MAKKDEDKKPAGSIPLPARFEIRTPAPGFRGQRGGEVECAGGRRKWKINFLDGLAWTDDEAAATACVEWGYQVHDHGEVANTLKPPAESKSK